MRVGGKVVGSIVIVVAVLALLFSLSYTNRLEQQRDQAIEQLMSLPEYAGCRYDAGTCPQIEENIVVPDTTGIGMALLAILLGVYLIRADHLNGQILSELKTRKADIKGDARRELILSVLTADERRIVEAVEEQPGISQATLRLRTDFSKAKLSTLLKELENRGVIARTIKGKTNTVHLKREL